MGLVRIETLPAPNSDIISGGQHFKTLTAAHFRLFMFSYFLSGFAELDILCRFFPTHSGEKLLDAEWNVTFWRVMNDCVYADSQPARKQRDSIQFGSCLSVFHIRNRPVCFPEFFSKSDLR